MLKCNHMLGGFFFNIFIPNVNVNAEQFYTVFKCWWMFRYKPQAPAALLKLDV